MQPAKAIEAQRPFALILDDVVKSVEALRDVLKTVGFEVAASGSLDKIGRHFAHFHRHPDERPDVFFVDLYWTLAEQDFSSLGRPDLAVPKSASDVGITIVSEIVLKDALLRNIPVILFSSYDAPPDKYGQLLASHGNLAFLAKDEFSRPDKRSVVEKTLTGLGVRLPGRRSEPSALRHQSYRAIATEIADALGVRRADVDRLVEVWPTSESETLLSREQASRIRRLLDLTRFLQTIYSPGVLKERANEKNLYREGASLAGVVRAGDWQRFDAICEAIERRADGVF